MAELKDLKTTLNGVVYNAVDFIDQINVQSIETGDGVTVVTMADGVDYHFTANSLKRRESGENQIPRPFIPNIMGEPQKEEKSTMANMEITRVDSTDPAKTGGMSQSINETFEGNEQLLTAMEKSKIADTASLEDVMEAAKKVKDLTEDSLAALADFDAYIADNVKKAGGAKEGDAGFGASKNFNDGDGKKEEGEGTKKTPRARMSAEELEALASEHRREIADLEGQRSTEDQMFIETMKAFITPYGYLPILKPVTRNDSRLSAKLVNKIPASKRTFAIGVPDEVKATIDKNNIPANYATAEYDIVYFESNPVPVLGVLAYLPRNFDPSVLETLSTNTSRAKIEGWAKAEGTASEVILRYISKEELLYIMVATACPAVVVDVDNAAVKSGKNLEFFYKRQTDTEIGSTWYNLISRDTGTGKARKGTSSGYIPLNTFVAETPKSTDVHMISAQMLGGPLFNPPTTQGKSITSRFDELTAEAKAMIVGNTRDTFSLKGISVAGGVDAISHKNRKDAPEVIKMLPARCEEHTTSKGELKTRFVKVNFLSYLENPSGAAPAGSKTKSAVFAKHFQEDIKQYSPLLKEAQKRRAKTSQSSMLEVKNKLESSNDILKGELPQLGKKTAKK